jgi:hypothetical protein
MDTINPKGPKTWAGVSRLLDYTSAIATHGTSGMPEMNAKVLAATRVADALSVLLKAAPVREGPAGLKGRGVFATRTMRRGDVCTAYPCDAVRATDEGGVHLLRLSSSAPVEEGDQIKVRLTKYAQFLDRDKSGRVWEVYGDPSLPFRAGACGHLINDPHPDATTIKKANAVGGSSEEYGQAMMEYMSSVASRTNCVMQPHRSGLGVLVVATRDIADGEELLTPYGYEYWSDATDPERMLVELSQKTGKQAKAMRAVMAQYVALFEV